MKYAITTTHTFNSNSLEDERFDTVAEAWRAAATDYLHTDADITQDELNAFAGYLLRRTTVGSATVADGESITVLEVAE